MTGRFGTVMSYAVLLAGGLVTVLPLAWVARTSLVSQNVAYQIPPQWFAPPSLENYAIIFSTDDFGAYFVNSMVVAVATTFVSVVLGALAAYGIVRTTKKRGRWQVGVLAGQFFPRITLLIPLYVGASTLGLLDQHGTLIVAFLAFSLPASIWIQMGFMQALPLELEEAAMMDGASRMRVLATIVAPLAAPGMVAAAVFAFMLSWNEFLFALFLGGRDTRTIPVAIASYITQRGVDIGPVAAAVMVSLLPVVLFSLVGRRYLVSGLTQGAVRG